MTQTPKRMTCPFVAENASRGCHMRAVSKCAPASRWSEGRHLGDLLRIVLPTISCLKQNRMAQFPSVHAFERMRPAGAVGGVAVRQRLTETNLLPERPRA